MHTLFIPFFSLKDEVNSYVNKTKNADQDLVLFLIHTDDYFDW